MKIYCFFVSHETNSKIKITRRAEKTALIGAEQIPVKRATKSDGVALQGYLLCIIESSGGLQNISRYRISERAGSGTSGREPYDGDQGQVIYGKDRCRRGTAFLLQRNGKPRACSYRKLS